MSWKQTYKFESHLRLQGKKKLGKPLACAIATVSSLCVFNACKYKATESVKLIVQPALARPANNFSQASGLRVFYVYLICEKCPEQICLIYPWPLHMFAMCIYQFRNRHLEGINLCLVVTGYLVIYISGYLNMWICSCHLPPRVHVEIFPFSAWPLVLSTAIGKWFVSFGRLLSDFVYLWMWQLISLLTKI